ncbi:MAG: hypothetical protein ABJ205_12550 [Erythrobacter sp.]|uniref:hypothetical protein n=1 Tax=Erythrobacter sp. TaxID=1042 RepID=UPI003266E765
MVMPANFQEALPFILLAIALLVAVWIILRASRKTKVIGEQEGDVLDEGVGPAARNQALIDAQPSTSTHTGVPLETADTKETQPVFSNEPVPLTAPAEPPVPAPTETKDAGASDDLKRIKGLGPKLVGILNEQGITSFAQIAAWTDADVERVDAKLGRFQGRITRDKWVEQSKLLVEGDESGFSETFGNNG